MGRYKDKHGYSRLSHWLGLDGADPFETFKNNFGVDLKEATRSLLAGWTGESMTGAQREANEFNAVEAEKNRAWETQMSNTAYQRQVSDMVNAGVNPALALGGTASGASTPSGTAAQSTAASPPMSMSDVMQIAMLPAQMKMLDQQVRGVELANQEKEIDLKFLEQEKVTSLALDSAQIEEIFSAIKTQEVERELKRSGISVNEAESQLKIQQAIATAIDNETRDALNNALLAYRAAETAYTEQKTEESKKNMQLMQSQMNELYSRSILNAAQAGYFSQSEKNLLIESGILRLDEQSKQFTVDHQRADRNWRIANDIVSDVTKVAGSVGQFVGGFGLLSRLRGKGTTERGSGLYYPDSMNAFGEHYRINR